MKILVIDDFAGNIVSAATGFAGHTVVTADTIEEAYVILNSNEEFDAVLTDLFLPIGNFRGCIGYSSSEDRKRELPAGLVFALKAVNKGIRTVICSDMNHHQDWICALLDLLEGDKSQRRVVCVRADYVPLDAYYDEGGSCLVPCEWDGLKGKKTVKDWHRAMKLSGLFSEVYKQ